MITLLVPEKEKAASGQALPGLEHVVIGQIEPVILTQNNHLAL